MENTHVLHRWGNPKPAHCPLVVENLMLKFWCNLNLIYCFFSPILLTSFPTSSPSYSSFDQWSQPDGTKPGGGSRGQTGHSERRNSRQPHRWGGSGACTGEECIVLINEVMAVCENHELKPWSAPHQTSFKSVKYTHPRRTDNQE